MIPEFPLSKDDRVTLYAHLADAGAFCGGEKRTSAFSDLPLPHMLAIAAEESRYDPRLLGILIDFFARHMHAINPFALREALALLPTPQTLGVIAGFAKSMLSAKERIAARHFFAIVLQGISPVPFQAYYNTQTRPRPDRMMQEMVYSPHPFNEWGFFGTRDPYLKERRPSRPIRHYAKAERARILENLAHSKPYFRMRDYLTALNGAVTRQQAHRDLRETKAIRRSGKTRGRTYSRQKPS